MGKEFQKRLLSSIILIPISFFFIFKGSNYFIIFLTILFLISTTEWSMMVKKNEIKIAGILFLLFSFYSAFIIREGNFEYFLLLLTICISTDIGGYIFGKIFGGPKLIKISPNKTYSGMLGSFLLPIIFSYIFLLKYAFELNKIKNFTDNYTLLLTVIVISTVSQTGDLIISFFKRSSKIKNTGKILPGHGGLLDRIDGMIFVFSFVYLIELIQG